MNFNILPEPNFGVEVEIDSFIKDFFENKDEGFTADEFSVISEKTAIKINNIENDFIPMLLKMKAMGFKRVQFMVKDEFKDEFVEVNLKGFENAAKTQFDYKYICILQTTIIIITGIYFAFSEEKIEHVAIGLFMLISTLFIISIFEVIKDWIKS